MEILYCQWFNFELPIGWNELGILLTAFTLLITFVFSLLSWCNIINEKRARVQFSIKNIDSCFWLTVENIGVKTANNILFSVNSELQNVIVCKGWYDTIYSASKTSFLLQKNEIKYFPLMPAFDGKKNFTDNIYNEDVKINDGNIRDFLKAKTEIKCSYKSGIWRRCVHETFTPEQFITKSIIPPSIQNKLNYDTK